jgi:hypothetical protein
MIKNITKGFLMLSFLVLLLAPATLVKAEDDPFGIGSGENGLNGLNGLDNSLDPRTSAISIINLVLSFLGLVAVVIILIGGFKWMTAGGSEEKVSSARKLLVSGLIGLVIILLAWGIATWVIGSVQDFN